MTKTTTTTATSNTAGLPWVGVKASTNLADGCALSLVLLRDLVRWLMRSKEIAFMGAARELHGALQGLAGLRLYVTGESGAARVVGASDTFGLLLVQRRIYSRGIGSQPSAASAPASLPTGVTPGASAALHYIGNGWGGGACPQSILDDNNNPASRLAMPCDQAADIWRAEHVSDATVKPLGSVAEEWTGEKLAAQQAVFKAAGYRDFAKRTWERAEVKERDGRRLVSEYEATKNAKSVTSFAFKMGKAVAKKANKQP